VRQRPCIYSIGSAPTDAARQEIQALVASLKEELQLEYKRLTAGLLRECMTLFELNVYFPAIEEAWEETDISPPES